MKELEARSICLFPQAGALARRPSFEKPRPLRRGSGPPNQPGSHPPAEGGALPAAVAGSGRHSGQEPGIPGAGRLPRASSGAAGTFPRSRPAAAHAQAQTLQTAPLASGVPP